MLRSSTLRVVAVALLALLPAAGVGGAPAPPEDAPATSVEHWTTMLDLAVSNVGFTIGVAWIDFDGDGDLDLHFTKGSQNGTEASRLLRNDGDGNFKHLAGSALSTLSADRAPAWGDYDNDGDPDCYITVEDGPNRLFRNDGAGGFREVTTPALAIATAGGCGWADYDNDGDLDLYVGAGVTGSNALFRNDGGAFVDVSVPPLDLSAATMCVAWGDYDNDGDQDLYLSINAGANRLFRNDDGVFTDVSAPPLDDAGSGHGAAWADYDNDGFLDLYLTNLFHPSHLFHNNGDGTFSDVSVGPLGDNRLNSACAWGDYDNDGFLDLYFDRALASNVLLHNDLVYGEFHFTDATEPPLVHVPLGGGVAWGDYDNDGDLDLVIATLQSDQPNRLIRNDFPPATDWLQVELQGVVSNRSGVGARLRAVRGHEVQVREVTTTSGLFSQNSMTQQFGFGPASLRGAGLIDTLEIRWPSGAVQRLLGVPPGRRILVVEDPSTVGLVVSGFHADALAGRVDLEWLVSQDHRRDGFLVHRAPSRDGPWRRVSDTPIRDGNPRRWADRDVEPLAVYFYALSTVEAPGDGLLEVIRVETPFWSSRGIVLEPARPNPFARVTEIAFSLPDPAAATLTVHDLAGRRIATIGSGTFAAGRQVLTWNGRDAEGRLLPAGVYWVRLDSPVGSEARRVVMLGR